MIRVAIVGLGRVGSQNDVHDYGVPLSHVGAALTTPGIVPVALIDSNPDARNAAQELWGAQLRAPILSEIQELTPGSADIIVLATPTALRTDHIAAALTRHPRLLLIEKPFTRDVATATELMQRAADEGVTIRVNFQRRFDPGFRRWRTYVTETPRHITMRYGKGLWNYGSHLVDFLIEWFGEIRAVQALSVMKTGADDPNISFLVHMKGGFDALIVGLDVDYDQFEIDIYLKDRRIDLASGGVVKQLYISGEDSYYRGYRRLQNEPVEKEISIVGGFAEIYAAMRAHLSEGQDLPGCDGQAAVAGVAVLSAVEQSAARGGSVVSLADHGLMIGPSQKGKLM
jgi:predicted dehydrogenase